ncbi:hypothetical protein ABT083_29875 [Streptomyces goshikiensis]|uniref:hypothetical protein n=1 Tax=Streptomyces goshikiensis TaxID=1942 RepID=UPI00331B4684
MHATAPDGLTWSPFTPVGDPGSHRTTGSPATVVFQDKLYCIYACKYPDQYAAHDGTPWYITFDGTRWSTASQLPGNRKTTPGAGAGPAILDGGMHYAVRGPASPTGTAPPRRTPGPPPHLPGPRHQVSSAPTAIGAGASRTGG